MNIVFGICMGAVIGRLLDDHRYFHVVLAVVALALHMYQLVCQLV